MVVDRDPEAGLGLGRAVKTTEPAVGEKFAPDFSQHVNSLLNAKCGRISSSAQTTIGKSQMFYFYLLLFRILSGEKYAPASREDTKINLAFLAAVPPGIGIMYPFASLMSGLSLFWVWLSATTALVVLAFFWYEISRIPSIKVITAMAVVGWAVAFWIAFQINR